MLLLFVAAYGAAQGDRTIPDAATEVFLSHPGGSGKQTTRHMARQLARESNSRLVRYAYHEQGLLHIFKGWCDRRSCTRCLVDTEGRW